LKKQLIENGDYPHFCGYCFKKFNLLVKYSGTFKGTLAGGQYTSYIGISGVYKF